MSARPVLRTARDSDLDALWPAVKAAHIFPDRAAFELVSAREPWRVLIGDRGSAALVERWRDHLDILAVRGLWASGRDLVPAIVELRALAAARGFTHLLSPLVSREADGPYRRAGLDHAERLVAYRMDAGQVGRQAEALPDAVELRPASLADARHIDRLDRECFTPFWAYGLSRIETALATDMVTVAYSAGALIGYTLSTVERGSGTLGRIAVSAGYRGRGVGAALLADSARALVGSGAACVSLCTQEANVAARALYVRAGMRELPGKLVFLIGDAVGDKGRL